MKRRSFLKGVLGAVAAVPVVGALAKGKAEEKVADTIVTPEARLGKAPLVNSRWITDSATCCPDAVREPAPWLFVSSCR